MARDGNYRRSPPDTASAPPLLILGSGFICARPDVSFLAGQWQRIHNRRLLPFRVLKAPRPIHPHPGPSPSPGPLQDPPRGRKSTFVQPCDLGRTAVYQEVNSIGRPSSFIGRDSLERGDKLEAVTAVSRGALKLVKHLYL